MTKRPTSGHAGKSRKPKRRPIETPRSGARDGLSEPTTVATAGTTPRPAGAPTPVGRSPRQSVLSAVRRPTQAAPATPVNYDYVFSDLRRIGILAAAGFAILAALTFIIR